MTLLAQVLLVLIMGAWVTGSALLYERQRDSWWRGPAVLAAGMLLTILAAARMLVP